MLRFRAGLACAAGREKVMADMSPLARFILIAMRWGCHASAAFVCLVIGIEAWKLWRYAGSAGNVGFLVALLAMLLGFLWLGRAITRELRR